MTEMDSTLAGSAASLNAVNFAAGLPQHLLIAQEVNIGVVRELVPPQEHIGLSIAPWLDVAADDVVFDYLRDSTTGMTPARAQDAESTLWADTEFYGGQGRASIIDWAEKNAYSTSDVTGYREMLPIVEQITGKGAKLPFYISSMVEGFAGKIARHSIQRRRRLDNRIEWLIMEAMSKGYIEYQDKRVKFKVDFKRPADQHDQALADYTGDSHDPIGDLMAAQKKVYDRTGVTLNRGEISTAAISTWYKSKWFRGLTGFRPGDVAPAEMPYIMPGFGPQVAIDAVEAATGIKFRITDNVLRTRGTRAGGRETAVNRRYFPADQVILYASGDQISAYDDTEIGFAKTLTSPHPANDWATGFYGWERNLGVDPYGYEVGSGVKAFPIFPHMELTYTMRVGGIPSA
ncbi:major capsid protein [Rhodococcus phage Reynauld]|uniref:Major capsid protein n=1 Tax=Rhodococcus phage Reynauld TaxID=3062845 RepID=A0ACD4UH65_9CAUD|nr:major capsid protein [Rhodococcus phage Reynauld]